MAINPAGEKVVILGGGMSALCAAFELSDPAEPQEYDITLYQLGWRLGGKGASGRNEDHADRIQEHGIHAFFGFYDNAFDIMQRCYRELGRGPGDALATWQDAFLEHDLVVLMDRIQGAYVPWELPFPRMPGLPGEIGNAQDRPSIWERVKALIAWLHDHVPSRADKAFMLIPDWAGPVIEEHAAPGEHPNQGSLIASAVHRLAQSMHADPSEHKSRHHHQVHGLLGLLSHWFEGEHTADADEDHVLRHVRLLADVIIANVRGILGDGLLFHSVTNINGVRYADWLASHGASEFVLESPILRGFHDLIFAYPGGDRREAGNIEAGYALNLLLMAMGWRGSLMWTMASGMGDVVFSPLYEVLAKRGVKFRFFHRVTGLQLDADCTQIASVTLSRQVQLKNGEYAPLVPIPTKKGTLPCWPDRPRYEQIVEGEHLRKEGIDLESHWTPWTDTGGEVVLRADQDFAKVILGIPIGAHPFLCKELIDASDTWREMVQNVPTVQTQSFQLWFHPTLEDLGWTHGADPILSAYDVVQTNSWALTNQVIWSEGWAPDTVGSLSYLCGPMIGPAFVPAASDRDFPTKEIARVHSNVTSFLEANVQALWPNAVADPATGRGFKYDLLVGGDLGSQYIRANIDPSERYVQSFADTTRFRLATDQSCFSNLLLTGDWIDNGINIGCIEGATVSGRQTARAISGRNMCIPHETPY